MPRLVRDSEPITPTKKIVLFNGRNLDGWYTWLKENKYEDPKKVFSVANGAIRAMSGEEWGGVATKQMYRDYHFIVEWKWGGPAHGDRAEKARDSGILVHGIGEDGADWVPGWNPSNPRSSRAAAATHDDWWHKRPWLTGEVRQGRHNQFMGQEWQIGRSR